MIAVMLRYISRRSVSNLSNMANVENISASNEGIIRADYRCFTETTRFECSFTWIINNLSLYYCPPDRCNHHPLVSPSFSSTNNTCNWLLEFNPTHEKRVDYDDYESNYDSNSSYMAVRPTELYLKIQDENEIDEYGPIFGEWRCSLVNSEGEKFNYRKEKFIMDKNSTSVELKSFITDDELFKEENKLLPKDTLTIESEISFILKTDITNILNRCNPKLLNTLKYNPMDEFAKLFNNEECSDVTIHVDNEKFHAHKVILAACSPVFKAMFSHSMTENRQNRIEIKDIDEKMFAKLLRYIYTGKVENLATFAFELLLVADKYNIEGLKCMCECAICDMISVESVLKTLLFSDQHNLQTLKAQAIKFIRINCAKVMKSPEWNDFSSQPALMKEICEACCIG